MAEDEVAAYDAELVARLRALLGPELVGLYVSGSTALGDYVPGKSDLDRFAVCERALSAAEKRRVVGVLRHDALPCPTRGLEFVLYTRAAAARPGGDGGFELNLNTGPAMPFRVAFDPAEEPAFWFILDRAIVRARGRALIGPPPAEVFAELPRAVVTGALEASLRWHLEHAEEAGPNLVLNACRAWRFAVEGRWASKRDAAAWARPRLQDASVVDAALARRHGDEAAQVDAAAARAVVERARAILR